MRRLEQFQEKWNAVFRPELRQNNELETFRNSKTSGKALMALALGLAALLPGATLAQDGKPCTAPEYRQFDFWLGKWNAKDSTTGEFAGTSRIEAMHGGCVISETWTNSSMTGSSLNIFNKYDKQWHQNWTDSTGRLSVMAGAFSDGAMTLTGEQPLPTDPSRTFLSRLVFTSMPDGKVKQLGQRSTDGGKSWEPTFGLIYEKAE